MSNGGDAPVPAIGDPATEHGHQDLEKPGVPAGSATESTAAGTAPDEAGNGGEVIEQLADRGRFRVVVAGQQVAELDYLARPGSWDLVHTYADPAYRGTGLASRLVTHVMDQARREGVGIVPSCPYIPVWLSRHPEYADLVVAG